MKKYNAKSIALIGMFCAVAYVFMVLIHIRLVPSAPFLTYDPKDTVIVIAGFIFGPVYSVIISVVVSFLEMMTVSDSGIIGFVMQVIATFSYAFVASFIYRKKRTKKTALISLIIGTVSMTVIMLLWNYILTPIYMGAPRETVVPLLLPAFLPFNLLKGIVNSLLAFLIYKPLVNALRKSHMLPERN